MRRGGSTAADARCSTTADQKHECQNAEDTSTYKMCVMTRVFSCHIIMPMPRFLTGMNRSSFVLVLSPYIRETEPLQHDVFRQCAPANFHIFSMPACHLDAVSIINNRLSISSQGAFDSPGGIVMAL